MSVSGSECVCLCGTIATQCFVLKLMPNNAWNNSCFSVFLPFWFLGFQNIVFPLALLVSQGGDHETSGSVGRGTTNAMNEPLGSWNDWHDWHNHLASQMLVVSENVPSGNLPLVYICPLVIH